MLRNNVLATILNVKYHVKVKIRFLSGIIKSPHRPITLPTEKIHEYVWRDTFKWPNKIALVCGVTGRQYTYEETHKKSHNFATCLRSKFSLTDGSTLATVLPTCPEFPMVFLGANEAGCVVTTVNPVYTPDEIQRQLTLSDAKIIVTYSDKIVDIKTACDIAKLNIPIISIDCTNNGLVYSFDELTNGNPDRSCLNNLRFSYKDVAVLPYSSGTTGLPKGVELTNTNIVSNCKQQSVDTMKYFTDTTESNQEVVLAVLPFFHIFGMSVIMVHKLALGWKCVTMPNFNIEMFIENMVRHSVTGMYVAPPLVQAMTVHPKVKPEHLESMKFIVSGAAPLAAEDIDRLHHKTGNRIHIIQGYGLTETSPVVTFQMSPDDKGTVGPPIPNTEVRIVADDGTIMDRNKQGEVQIRGPQVMKGYRTNPKANSDVFTDDGWFRTGDLGSCNDNGCLIIHDRMKELIKVKGFQVAPAELEALLRTHHSVKEAAVIGIPDKRLGESPRAYIVLKDNVNVSADEITDFVNKKVADFKRIKDIVFLEQIPKSVSGKILRKDLKNIKIG